MNFRNALLLFALVFVSTSVHADTINTWMMADDKINVVVVVSFVVLAIMTIWLFRIESRLGKIERRLAQSKS
ncbi:MAG: hypothetical protein ACKORE_09170 [Bacteroidota bacterium]